MTRCLRIFGAYTCKLRRRQPTVILLGSFILIITVIFHLYAYRHHDHYSTQPRIGDFDYQPGNFLKGQQPNENLTYCDFQYGLPDKLDWNKIITYPSPELGSKGPYTVIYNAIKGTAYANFTKYNALTYVTQATPEFIYHIVEISRYWDGPISLSVYVPNYDLDITLQIMTQLCRCYEGMSKVSLHLFYPNRLPPIIRPHVQVFYNSPEISTKKSNLTLDDLQRKKLENFRKLDKHTRAEYIRKVRQNKAERMMIKMKDFRNTPPNLQFIDCTGPINFDSSSTFRRRRNMAYPINVGRNVARNASTTNYFIVSDIEMVPSDGLAGKFLTMIRGLMGSKKREEGCIFAKTVFVVPLFEVERGEEIPRDKDTLVRMVAANRAMYFHQKRCGHCQRFPGLQTWLLRPAPNGVEPMMIGKREYPYHRWEPLYFGTQKEPWYNEVLSWEGRQDKMIQMLELCLQDYRMIVIDGGFLCHAAASNGNTNYPLAARINSKHYAQILNKLKHRYSENPQCKPYGYQAKTDTRHLTVNKKL